VDAHGLPVRVIITEGTKHDSTQAELLIDGIEAEYVLADKAYDSDSILEKIKSQNGQAVIPPRSSRINQRVYDKDIYKLRHMVENAMLHLKRWRGIATRYAKNTASFLAAVQIRCMMLWLQ
jgi:transposase